MTLAVSTSVSILTGVAVLGIGLLLLSTYVLVVDRIRVGAMRRTAKETYLLVSTALKTVGPEEEGVDVLRARAEESIRGLRSGGSRTDFENRLSRTNELLSTVRHRTAELRMAQEAAMRLSVDELGYLSDSEEADVADLVSFSGTAEALEAAVADTRRQWGL